MSVDCPFPSTFDMLSIYDKLGNLLMELPLCEVIPGDVDSIDDNEIKMKLFDKKDINTYTRNDFVETIQSAFQFIDIDYVEIVLAKDHTKVRI